MVQMLFESKGRLLCASLPRRFHDAARTLLQSRTGSRWGAIAGIVDMELCCTTGISHTCRTREKFSGAGVAIESYPVHTG